MAMELPVGHVEGSMEVTFLSEHTCWGGLCTQPATFNYRAPVSRPRKCTVSPSWHPRILCCVIPRAFEGWDVSSYLSRKSHTTNVAFGKPSQTGMSCLHHSLLTLACSMDMVSVHHRLHPVQKAWFSDIKHDG